MKKTVKRRLRSILSLTIILSLILAVFAPIEAAAGEITGYQNGAVVRFKNVYTGYYLNLSGANDANGANVNIFQYDGSPEETWMLRYNATNDVYLIGSMVSSNGDNRVIDVKRGGQAPKTGCNVQLYSATDPTSQQWVFQYHSNGRYTIRLKAATGLALTASTVRSAAGTYNGTSTGTLPTSPGNVFISSLPGYDANGALVDGTNTNIPTYQLWEIEEVSPQRTIADGIYSINSLAASLVMGVGSSDYVQAQTSTNSNSQKWKVTYNSDGYYTIRPMSNLTKVLTVSGALSLSSVTVDDISAANDYAKWKIVPNANGAGYRLTCKAGYYSNAAWLGYNQTSPNTGITQIPYSNLNTQQWVFTLGPYDAVLLSVEDNSGFPSYGYMGDTLTAFREAGKDELFFQILTSTSVNEMISYMKSSPMFIIQTHGDPIGFAISSSELLTMNDLKTVNLSHLELALLLTCDTGKRGFDPARVATNSPVNMVEQMICSGAKNVVGFSEQVEGSDCNKFAPDFMQYILDGLSVEEAIDEVDYREYVNPNMKELVVVGFSLT